MKRPTLVIATVSNMPIDPDFNNIIASCRHMTGLAQRFDIQAIRPRQAITTEEGLLAEAMALAKGAVLLERAAVGMGVLTWRLAPETTNPAAVSLAAFANRVGDQAYPLGFATTEEQYETVQLMAQSLYGTSSVAPEVICLSERSQLHRMVGLSS